MVDDFSVVNLFGDVVAAPQEGPGRPAHAWSLENSNKVLLAFARGLSVKDAATAIGVSAPTLRKVYFSEVKVRAAAKLRMEMTQLARLNDQAAKGNITAEKELMKALEKMRQRDEVQTRAPTVARHAAPPRLGKKEKRDLDALEVSELYEPLPPPAMLQ